MSEKPEFIESALDSEPLSKYGLRYVGHGDQNVCFETAASEKKLIKVSTEALGIKVIEFLEQKRSGVASSVDTSRFSAEDKWFADRYVKEIADKKEQEEAMSAVFGNEHVLKTGSFKFRLPLTKKVIVDMLPDDHKSLADVLKDDEVSEIEMPITTQPIAPELKDQYSHKTQSFNTVLMTVDQFRSNQTIEAALDDIKRIIDYDFLNEMKGLLENGTYAETIKEVMEKIVAYSKKTGLMLDIFGPNNLTLFTDADGKPDFHVIDGTLPGPKYIWEMNISDDPSLHLLRHYYTYYYSVHSLTEILGLKDNLELDDLVYFKGHELPKGELPKS